MKTVYKTPIFSLVEEKIEGRTFVKLDSPDWVNVVPLNEKNEILFIKQFRHGTQELTLETPGGLIDSGDASPEAAARRELLEETGYSSGEWEELGWVYANPAYQNNRCTFFLARNIKKTAELKLDEDEKIHEMLFIPEKEALRMLRSNQIIHSIIVANLSSYFLKKGLV